MERDTDTSEETGKEIGGNRGENRHRMERR